jgi:hypothetical protein
MTLLLLFYIHSKFSNNGHSSYPYISMKRPLLCSGTLLFTSVDKSYFCASLSFDVFNVYTFIFQIQGYEYRIHPSVIILKRDFILNGQYKVYT